ncbi:MAG: hypothetical protein ACT4PL_12010 [Phycisphaerales bacterium]
MNRVLEFFLEPWAQRRVEEPILNIVGEASRPLGAFRVRLPWGDPRIEQVYAVLRAAGIPELTRTSGREVENSPRGYYKVQTLHRFTPEEYATAEYLWLMGRTLESYLAVLHRGADGELLVHGLRPPPRDKLYGTEEPVISDTLFVPEIEAEGFVGMAFRGTKMAVQTRERDAVGVPVLKIVPGLRDRGFVEIFPTVELPAMVSGEIEWMQYDPGHVARPTGPGTPRTPGFDDFQPVYTRTALRSAGAFDIARTLEFRSARYPEDRMYITSQRFRQFLCRHGIEAEWVPVKIIED